MATRALFNTWKIIHAKFVKPVDNALDSFAMLMLQWLMGVYNFWDVLRISSSVCLSAAQYLAKAIRHPSVLWTSPPTEPEEEATEAEAEAEVDTTQEGDEEEDSESHDQPPGSDPEDGFDCDNLADAAPVEGGNQPADGDRDGGPLRRRQTADSMNEAGVEN